MVNPVMENQPYPEQYIPITLLSGRPPPPWGLVPINMICLRSDTVLLEVFFPIT